MIFRAGDLVLRKSYGCDIIFKIIRIDWIRRLALIKGVDLRLIADAPLKDLKKASGKTAEEKKKKYYNVYRECMKKATNNRSSRKDKMRSSPGVEEAYYEIPGRVLHLDGDREYLEECQEVYRGLGIKAEGQFVPEKDQPHKVLGLLQKYQPDILVLTGHDALKKKHKNFQELSNYRNSQHFVKAVASAREYQACKDSLIIVAGACQSHYEGIIGAGANYASSPHRIMIHYLDPVFISEKLAYTSTEHIVNVREALGNTVTGSKGMGGIQTRGILRLGMPKSPY